MHIRSRLHHRRLQISLVDTQRADGKVRQEHVASLAFWTQVHPRLSRLDNRLSPEMRARVMGELHAVVPMVSIDAAIAGKIETADRNLQRSTKLRDMFQEMVSAKKAMLVQLQRDIAEGEAQAAKMDGAVKRDQDKLTRLKAGEDVPVGEELDYAAVRAICKNAGWSRGDFHRAALMQQLDDAALEEYLLQARHLATDTRRETRLLNKLLKQQRDDQGSRTECPTPGRPPAARARCPPLGRRNGL